MRRELGWFDWTVRAPIGFVWMIMIAILAVPVMIYMTALYYLARWASALFGKRRTPRLERAGREKPVA